MHHLIYPIICHKIPRIPYIPRWREHQKLLSSAACSSNSFVSHAHPSSFESKPKTIVDVIPLMSWPSRSSLFTPWHVCEHVSNLPPLLTTQQMHKVATYLSWIKILSFFNANYGGESFPAWIYWLIINSLVFKELNKNPGRPVNFKKSD
jgi:hypothetical protein